MLFSRESLKPHLLFFVSEDWYFVSHRLPVAEAAIRKGYKVSLVTRVNKHAGLIRGKGIHLVPVNIQRGSLNVFDDILLIISLVRIYRELKPDIVHHVAIKPVIYGSLAATISGVPAKVNALAGLGFLFSSPTLKARLLRNLVIPVMRLLLKGEKQAIILQNPDDARLLTSLGVVHRSTISIVKGSGVDTERFKCASFNYRVPVVVLAARMLSDKGVVEFVSAARQICQDNLAAEFILAGPVDGENPASIPFKTLYAWNDEGCVRWVGDIDDMPALFSRSSIVCLPSYREGLPKVLAEAASCGRPIIATDVPGCREIVRNGVNGLLVPVKDENNLYKALKKLIQNPDLCDSLGKNGREIAVNEFSLPVIITQILTIYRRLLDASG